MRRSFPLQLSLVSLATVLVAVACTTVPDTGRRQFNPLAPNEEAKLGLTEFEKMKQSKPISRNAAYNDQVQRVGQQLARVMPVPNAQWEFVVFEDNSPNAFALPGGKVGVHTGLFQITQSDTGLAAVIGHEVAHVVARHSGERMAQAALSTGVAAVASEVLRRNSEMGTGGQVASTAAIGGAALLHVQRFSRNQELEADQLGALYMARAGYDPRESVALWKRFAAWRQTSGNVSKTPAFLSTHPVDEVRIAELERFMPRALSEYRG
ncbi:MAG: M48 family metallopeptidase [Verrucomicrobiae bacterium]|nr:M48 family metallopeptidase [Verrucomicrobiae bacterium]